MVKTISGLLGHAIQLDGTVLGGLVLADIPLQLITERYFLFGVWLP